MRWRCACQGRWLLLCHADRLSHRALGRRYLHWLCHLHDRHLLNDADDEYPDECPGYIDFLWHWGDLPVAVTTPPEG